MFNPAVISSSSPCTRGVPGRHNGLRKPARRSTIHDVLTPLCFRPIPVHCAAPCLDPLLLIPPPSAGLDLRLPWKSHGLKIAPSSSSSASSLSPFPLPSQTHPLALFHQLRRHHHHHLLMTSERLAGDAVLPKTSPALPATSPVSTIPDLRHGGAPARWEGKGGGNRAAEGARGGATVIPSLTFLDSSAGARGLGTSLYGRKVFPCPQCRYTTDRRNNLKRHMLTMHQVTAKLLECCGVLFRTKAALREHALVFHYHGYTCCYCARRFCRKALLKRHLSVHNGQKEFLCDVCDYATSHKSNLERHRRVHLRQDEGGTDGEGLRPHDVSDDVKSNVSETQSHIEGSLDDLSVCSDDEDEEINVHSD